MNFRPYCYDCHPYGINLGTTVNLTFNGGTHATQLLEGYTLLYINEYGIVDATLASDDGLTEAPKVVSKSKTDRNVNVKEEPETLLEKVDQGQKCYY